MTSTHTTTIAFTVPSTQNTAPVFEHRCLYTADLRRKNKRWQDGFLRFHAFNRRVMVYDVPRNLLGDTYWQGDCGEGEEVLRDGDVLELERSGILVQVAERNGRSETDLGKVVGWKNARVGRQAEGWGGIEDGSAEETGLRSAVMGRKTLGGLANRARVPVESPFDIRSGEEVENEWEAERPRKRPRTDDHHRPLCDVIRMSKPGRMASRVDCASPLAAKSSNAGMIRTELGPKSKIMKQVDKGQARLRLKELVDLTSSSQEIPVGATESPERMNVPGNETDVAPRPSPPPRRMIGWMRQQEAAVRQMNGQKRPSEPCGDTSREGESAGDGQIRRSDPPSHLSEKNSLQQQAIKHNAVGQARISRTGHLPMHGINITNQACTASTTHEKSVRNMCKSPNSRTTTLPAQDARPPASPPVSIVNHLALITDDHPKVVASGLEKSSNQVNGKASDAPKKSLRLSSGPPRRMLLCQNLAQTSSPSLSSHSGGTKLSETHLVELEEPTKTHQEGHRSRATKACAATIEYQEPEKHSNTGDFSIPKLDSAPRTIPDNPASRTIAAQQAQILRKTPPISVPPDYRRLDARLMRRISNTFAQPLPRETPAASTTKSPPSVNHVSPGKGTNRTFGRSHSDTTPVATAFKQHQPRKQPLRRVETDPSDKARTAQLIPTKTPDTDIGPWSREAWDLFGWCPPAKVETLGWKYGEEVEPLRM